MRISLVSVILVIYNLMSYAQDEIVMPSQLAEAEFHTAINPTDPNNIVVVTMHGFEEVTDSYFSIYYTLDFGESWKKSDFQGMHDGHDGTGDPVIAFNSNGDLFLTHLVVKSLSSDPYDVSIETIVSVSYDKGNTWFLEYAYTSPFSDKPWITIDNSPSSPHNGNIYVPTVVNDVVMISLNPQGEYLAEVIAEDGDHIPSVVTDRDGEVYLSTMEWTDPISMYVQQYTNAGTELVHSSFVTTFPDYTFDMEDISTRFQPAPYIAIDNSEGPYSGRLYMAYTGSEETNPDFFNIFLTYSDDKGQTWSTPKIVHSDTSSEVQQYYSSIYVNSEGVLMLDWYDRSNFDNTTQMTDFFFGVSYDGGETFTEVKLTSEPMDFGSIVYAGFGFGIGEYHQCVATEKTAVSFWSDGRMNDGNLNIYFAKVDLENPTTSVFEQSLINQEISFSSLYPQPVSDALSLDVNLKSSKKIRMEVSAITGEKLIQGNWESYNEGTHKLTKNINLSSGEYILNLSTEDGYFKNLKFVVIR